MTDTIAWIIAVAFYAPFHYLGPLLVSFLTGTETPPERKRLIIVILIDCTLSMLVAFFLAYWLYKSNLQLAMLMLLLSMCIPYLHIAVMRKFRTR
jgi:hypothetical protein